MLCEGVASTFAKIGGIVEIEGRSAVTPQLRRGLI